MFQVTPSVLVAIVLLGTGCGDDSAATDSGMADSGVDGRADSGFTVAEPVIPWLADGVPPVSLTPCPEGWREVTTDGVAECQPYPADGPRDCAAGEAHFPGEAGCRSIGDPCPAGDYATALPTGGPVIYVDPTAVAGGDGTASSPYAALSDVDWPTLAAGTTVALAKGTFAGVLPLEAGVSVVGACVEETIVTGAAGEGSAVVVAEDPGDAALVRNLTISAPPQRGAEARGGGTLEVRGVFFEEALEAAALAFGVGTTLTLSDTVIRATRTMSSDGTGGNGLYLGEGAEADATRMLISGSHDVGVIMYGAGTTLTLRDAVIRETAASSFNGGFGVYVDEGASLDAARVMMVDNDGSGVVAYGPDVSVRLSDAVIQGTRYDPGLASGGEGLYADEGALVDLERVLLTGHEAVAIISYESATVVTMTDVIIRGVELTAATQAAALSPGSGSRIDATRVLIEQTGGPSVFATDDGTVVTLTDVAIRDSRPTPVDEAGGRGLNVQDGARVEVDRLLIEGAHGVGVFVADGASSVQLRDSVIRDTLAPSMGDEGGVGVVVQTGGHFAGSRLLVAQSRRRGIFGSEAGTTMMLTDTTVRDTVPDPGGASATDGLLLQNGVVLEGLRLLVDGVSGYGISVVAGATANLRDTSVAHVQAVACDPPACLRSTPAYGVASVGATIALSGFTVRDAETCGVFIAAAEGGPWPPSLDLDSGEVTGSLIGACVQVDGYDLGRLSNDVAYYDNGINLDSTTLPVPEPADLVDSI